MLYAIIRRESQQCSMDILQNILCPMKPSLMLLWLLNIQIWNLISDPAAVKAATIQYFQCLFHHTPAPNTEKPWLNLNSPAVHENEICACVTAFPFMWPRLMTLDKLQSLLHQGNLHPSPGPNGWE